MGNVFGRLKDDGFGIVVLEATRAIVRQPTPFLHQLCRCVRRLRIDRRMVSVAGPQRSSTKNCPYTSALRHFSRKWLDVLDAGSRFATATESFRNTDRPP